MSTIRGYKKGIDDESLRDVVDKYTAHIATVAARAGRESMKELRTSAVKRWYSGSTSAEAMNAATEYKSEIHQKRDEIEITITSYINFDIYDEMRQSASSRNMFSHPYENVASWRKRHEKDGWQYKGEKHAALDMPYSIAEYLFRLPWKEGLIALPPHERKTGTGWVNPAKKIYNDNGEMQAYVENDLNKKWNKTVKKKFDELRNKI